MSDFFQVPSALTALIGAGGGMVAAYFGGWDAGLKFLLALMVIDYITGLMCAGVFHASPKTEGGGLESRAGWKGLCRKGMTLLIVLIAHGFDQMLGTSVVRDGTVIAYIIIEVLSITENAGTMGVPVPEKLKKAIEVLEEKEKDE